MNLKEFTKRENLKINFEAIRSECESFNEFNFKYSEIQSEDKETQYKKKVFIAVNKIKEQLKIIEEFISYNNLNESTYILEKDRNKEKNNKSSESITPSSNNTEIKDLNTPCGILKQKKNNLRASQIDDKNIPCKEIIKKDKEIIIWGNLYSPICKIKETEFYHLYTVTLNINSKSYLMEIFPTLKSEEFFKNVKAYGNLVNCRYFNKIVEKGVLNDKYDFILFEYTDAEPDLLGVNLNITHTKINEKLIFFYFVQVYYATCEMHFNGVVHFNIDIKNLVFDKQVSQIYLTNFSNCFFNDEDDLNKKNNLKKYAKRDVLALGLILCQLIFGIENVPFDIKINIESEIKETTRKLYGLISKSELKENLRDFLFEMLRSEDDKRINLCKVQHLNWFKEMKQEIQSINSKNLTELLNIIIES